MSSTTIRFVWKVNGALADVTSAILSNPDLSGSGGPAADSFGVRRTDTQASVVDAGTALVRVSTGVYEYTFTDPAAGLTYNYWVRVVYQGATYNVEKNVSGPAAQEPLPSYLSVADADILASALPAGDVSSYTAADDAAKTAALAKASSDIDAAMRYQGRKYDLVTPQALEFPRVAYGSAISTWPTPYPSPDWIAAGASDIWDWDADANAAVVPQKVKLACLHQAESILRAKRGKRLDAQHDGVSSQGAGSVNEAYTGERPKRLCREAWDLMAVYRLRSGEML